LPAGVSLGTYEIVAPLGAGGMGEVYRARDTKLKRDVALKVLPDAYARDPERMARFQREAEVLASLNHPNIAHIYGVEERALVMELVEGESPKGPMPFEEAWKIALQIADALEYAHDRGVIHRDLKPANVKVTPEGVVKLLDFGLAKAFSQTPDLVASDPEKSPTVTLGATVAGTVLGTAAYMAPEQAKGKKVDKRADIWSWGVVLYELLTGERLFKGEDAADTLAQVLTKQPDLDRVAPQVRKLLGRCLEKDPKPRLRDIGDARDLLVAQPVLPAARWRLGWAAAAVLLVVSAALGAVAWKHFREEQPHVVKLFFTPPEKEVFSLEIPTMVVSPDGRRIAFETRGNGRKLWVRNLDDPSPRMLSALDIAPELPIWAPDGRRLAFFDGANLKRIDLSGGPAVTLADTVNNAPGSGSWNQDDVIVFGRFNTPLFRVPASGGSPAPVTALDKARGETTHWAPWFLPDGRHFLYVALASDPEKSAVYVGDLNSRARKQVIGFGTRTIYVNPGYLLYLRDRTLVAQPFDARKLQTTGDSVQVAEQVDDSSPIVFGLGHFSASQNGVLAYTLGGPGVDSQLTWFDRTAKKLETAGAPGLMQGFSLSPNDTAVVVARRDAQGKTDLWLRDLAHPSESRLTSTGNNAWPVWSADGTHIYFLRTGDGTIKIYHKAAYGTGPEEVVEATNQQAADASSDGRYLFTVASADNKTGADIWVIPLFGDHKPYPYIQSGFRNSRPRLSPNRQWLAYESNESGRNEIFVVGFPKQGRKWPISTSGGAVPVWSHDGRELFYYSAGKIMAVDIKPGAQFQYGTPKALFDVRLTNANTTFYVSKDGRFLLPALVEQQLSTPTTVVLNWPEELLKRK
jgi:Tol biopolymer transport system component